MGLCANDYLDREVDVSLSGGEVKRIEIATILARQRSLMIFDEPEAGIDLWSFARLTETFEQIHQQHRATMIIISHQERIIRLADEIVVIARRADPPTGAPRRRSSPRFWRTPLGGCPGTGAQGGARMMDHRDRPRACWKRSQTCTGKPVGAFNIRKDMRLRGRVSPRSTSTSTAKTDGKPGIDIHIKDGTKGETCHIPVIITQTGHEGHGVQRLLYRRRLRRDHRGRLRHPQLRLRRASRHDGIHTFYVGKNCRVRYTEKHYGEGATGEPASSIMNPQTIVYLEEGATMQMDTIQIRGIDSTKRDTKIVYGEAGSEAVVTEQPADPRGPDRRERHGDPALDGEGARGRVISRSVAQDTSQSGVPPA